MTHGRDDSYVYLVQLPVIIVCQDLCDPNSLFGTCFASFFYHGGGRTRNSDGFVH